MQVDRIFELLGKPGRYHIFIAVTLLFNFWLVGFSHINMTFYGAHAKHRCKLPEGERRSPQDAVSAPLSPELLFQGLGEETRESAIRNSSNSFGAHFYDINDEQRDTGRFENVEFPHRNVTVGSCHVYENFSADSNRTVPCPIGWDYDVSEGEQTLVTEWDLVCDRAYLNSLATTIYFFGVMIGGIVFGPLADHYGRRPVVLVSLISTTGIGIGLAFVQHYILFVVLRFLQGGFVQGLQTTTFILLSEVYSQKLRYVVAPLQALSADVNNMVFSLVCYLLPNWRHSQLTYTVPFVLLFSQIWTIPESARWLLMHGRTKEANRFFERVARFNKVELPSGLFEANSESLLKERDIGEKTSADSVEEKHQKQKRYSFLDLLRTPNLRRRALILFYLAFSIQLANYGVTLGTGTLPGNKFLLFFIGSTACAPNSLICTFLQKRFGRKRPLSAALGLLSIGCVIAGTVPENTHDGINIKWMVTVFALFARQMAGLSYLFLIISMVEMFPTAVRNIGAGGCTTFMRIGVMLSSQALLLGEYTFLQLPFLIFGAAAGLASALALLLPEDRDSLLPDTIEDVESADDRVVLCGRKKKTIKISETVVENEKKELAETSSYEE